MNSRTHRLTQGRYYRYGVQLREVHSRRWPKYMLQSSVISAIFLLLFVNSAVIYGAIIQTTKPLTRFVATNTSATPVNALSFSREDPSNPNDIEKKIREVVGKNRKGAWGVAVYDLGSDEWIARVNSEYQMETASLYKLYTVLAVSRKVPTTDWVTKKIGNKTISECVDLMLRVSDNPCAIALTQYVGVENIDAISNEYGYDQTILSRKKEYVTSPRDTVLFMRDLYYNDLFDKTTTDSILDSLSKQQFRAGIPSGCKDCKTWNKTGELAGVAHDAAIVEDGQRKYAVVIMTEDGSFNKIASLQSEIQKALRQ